MIHVFALSAVIGANIDVYHPLEIDDYKLWTRKVSGQGVSPSSSSIAVIWTAMQVPTKAPFDTNHIVGT